ncbi:MAG: hypothetical protein HY423_12695 [Candidatus Lambdaproteobacteria bacterium]|nr:hypothetical protein [Candidatus Lambdaproteobacteria bacterium]
MLSYKSITHLAAHSVLAVADASYLVLSLEGPRWVIYAVKGNLSSGEELTPGTILDLKRMQANGEVFCNLPVSDAEMSAVVASVPASLPTAKAAPGKDEGKE